MKCPTCQKEMKAGLAMHMKTHETNKEALPGTPQDPNSLLIAVLEGMKNSLIGLDKRLAKIEETQTKTATEMVDKLMGKEKDDTTVDDTVQEMKIHPTHRKIVDEILGEQFFAWESYEGVSSTHFQFNVEVPEKLSSISKADRQKGQRTDIRTITISIAEGENGVRKWCKKIRTNLNQYYNTNAIPSPFTTAVE